MGGLVCFDVGLAMGESVDELLAVGGLVCFDEGASRGRIR
jgi:hypothetical protein